MLSKVSENLNRILGILETLKNSRNLTQNITLIAVSKLQPIESIQEAYNCGHRDFGENYVDELLLKSQALPRDIKWHMIGHIQTNKINKLLAIPNLYCIHTIDSINLANKIQSKLIQLNKSLGYFMQINTSGEASKAGVCPESSKDLFQHISLNCTNLKFKGLMTIGERGNSEDFQILNQVRLELSSHFSLPTPSIELSMGMSGDYEEALLHNSNFIRIGTSIFGERKP